MSATANERDSAKCAYVLGEDGLASWDEVHSEAWIGFLEAHKHLTRALDAELEAEHGLSLSALEVLARLAARDNHSLGLSALAGASGLSLSRVSRIMGTLEGRGLVARRAVQSDARAVQAELTEAGLVLARRAQATHFASVQHRFFEPLGDEEVATLAQIFSKLVPVDADACTATAREDQLATR